MPRDTEFTQAERDNIIRDITSWKIESVEVGNGDYMADEEVREYISELRDCDDDTLRQIWFTNVGEWVGSRRDCTPTEEELAETGQTFDEWMDGVFDSVKTGDDIPHGYICPLQKLPA